VTWTPRSGARSLSSRSGADDALELLTRLLRGEVSGPALTKEPWFSVLADIGDGHATRLLTDPTGQRLAYWPRAWAARSLAYLKDRRARVALLDALSDEHWRVRMNSVQTLGRLGLQDVTTDLIAMLDDEHERVRAAAAVALGRVGGPEAIETIKRLLDDPSDERFTQIDRVLKKIERRK
jgi:HEAT repeat protein